MGDILILTEELVKPPLGVGPVRERLEVGYDPFIYSFLKRPLGVVCSYFNLCC